MACLRWRHLWMVPNENSLNVNSTPPQKKNTSKMSINYNEWVPKNRSDQRQVQETIVYRRWNFLLKLLTKNVSSKYGSAFSPAKSLVSKLRLLIHHEIIWWKHLSTRLVFSRFSYFRGNLGKEKLATPVKRDIWIEVSAL